MTLLALLIFAAPASALNPRFVQETFGSAAQPTFPSTFGLAFDHGDNKLFVVTNSSIRRYNTDGTPADFSALGTNVIDGIGSGQCATVPSDCDQTPENVPLSFQNAPEVEVAVDESGTSTDGNIYVTQSSSAMVDIFADDGHYLGRLTKAGTTNFSESCGVAVDQAGDVYVGDYGGSIYKFVPTTAKPLNTDLTATYTSVPEACTLSVGGGSTAGFLFASSYAGPVYKLDTSTGLVQYAVATGENTTQAFDPVSGHIFVASGAFSSGIVTEYDVSGNASAVPVSHTSPPAVLQGVAVNGALDNVYVARAESPNVEVFGPAVPIPSVVTSAPTGLSEAGATLRGTVDPEGVVVNECFFEYGTTLAYGQVAPCAESTASIGSGSAPVTVHADVTGLTALTLYHFRLIANNVSGTGEGSDRSFGTPTEPTIDDMWAGSVSQTEATLKARITPRYSATSFHIEYGPTNAYGAQTPERTVGADNSSHLMSSLLSNLGSNQAYHWRVVASSALGTVDSADHVFTTQAYGDGDSACPNQALRTGPAATLPDCRGYELVSPIDKNGGDIVTLCQASCYRTLYDQSSIDGETFTYSAYKAFGDQESNQYSNQYMATRGPNGWMTKGINPPQGTTIFDPNFGAFTELETKYEFFTPDLSSAWLRDFNKLPLDPNGLTDYMNLYRRDNNDGSYHALTVQEPLGSSDNKLGSSCCETAELQGVSDDGSHSVFAARAPLTPDAATNTARQLYDFSNGELKLVSILPSGLPSTGDSNAGTYNAFTHADYRRASARTNAVSEDGSRIFWSTGERIYARVDGNTTIPVSSGAAQYWSASTNGQRVLFSDSLGALGAGTAKIYEFNVDSEATTLIAGDSYGIAGAADDLSYVYFVSREVLDGGALAGEPNLYVWHGGESKFIGTVAGPEVTQLHDFVSIVQREPIQHASRVTPDGRHLTFESTRSLTGYDNTDAATGKADLEVYTYDAQTGELTCVSCNPSGARPLGQALQKSFQVSDEPTNIWAAAWLTTEGHSLYSSRPISTTGNRVFFNSFDALVPRDTNGRQDVYEWEEAGTGSCKTTTDCVSLISTGQSPRPSEFIDASVDGDNVFFTTEESIDPEDPGLIDIYAAPVGGGFPHPEQPNSCAGDACQSPLVPPNDPTAASAGFRGAGNPSRSSRGGCASSARRAAAFRRRASHLRRIADPATTSPRRLRKLRQQATELTARAEKLKRKASRCRRTNREAGK